jgi:hypothetical protein
MAQDTHHKAHLKTRKTRLDHPNRLLTTGPDGTNIEQRRLRDSLSMLLWLLNICFSSCTTIFSSAQPWLLQLQLYVVLLEKSTGSIQKSDISIIYSKLTCFPFFSSLQ